MGGGDGCRRHHAYFRLCPCEFAPERFLPEHRRTKGRLLRRSTMRHGGIPRFSWSVYWVQFVRLGLGAIWSLVPPKGSVDPQLSTVNSPEKTRSRSQNLRRRLDLL